MKSLEKLKSAGNILILTALFIVTNLEWNYFSLYLKFASYDLYILFLVLCAAAICYCNKDDLKNTKNYAFAIAAMAVSAGVYFLARNKGLAIAAASAVIILWLSFRISFTRRQAIMAAIWSGLFYFYWTFDVKGYFKGYDTYYGSIILFAGFVFTFIVFEYIKFYLKTSYAGTGRLVLFLSRNDYIIGFIEAYMIVWAYKIMTWYQSITAFYLSLAFIILIILPWNISPFTILNRSRSRFNYISNISLCGIIAILAMYAVSFRHAELFSAPFLLMLLCLIAIYNGFRNSGESEEYHVFDSEIYRKDFSKNWLKNGAITALSGLTVLVPVAVLAPLENYYPNIKDLAFSVSDFYPGFVKWTVISVVVLFIVGMILRKESRKLICIILFALGVVTYIQIMFMNTKLCEADGSKLDMSTLGNYPKVNLIIWMIIFVAVIVTLFVLKNKWTSVILFVGGALCAIQIVAAVSLPFSYITRDRSLTYELCANDEFEIAPNKNIIVFVLDSVGNVQFDWALERYNDLAATFSDFTYYNNADCSYAWTNPSMTHMYTGSDVDFDYSSQFNWQYDAWNGERPKTSFGRLHDAGYKVCLYTGNVQSLFGDGENLVGCFDNIKQYAHTVDREGVSSKMLRFSMFKALPYAFKEKYLMAAYDFDGLVNPIRDENEKLANYDLILFYDRLCSEGISINDEYDNSVKIIHLLGSHYTEVDKYLDENFEIVDETDRAQRTCANLRVINQYLDELRRLGKYDDTTVIITADHGTYEDIADPQPVLLVKDGGESMEQMGINTAPVSHNDFMPSILKYAGLEYSDLGKSYTDYEQNEERERTVGYLTMGHGTFMYFTYTGDRNELLKKFPDNPDYVHASLP